MADAPERTKPSDVALAEAMAWRRSLDAAQAVLDVFCDARARLREAGFPPTDALCEELYRDARRWIALVVKIRHDMIEHCKVHHLEIPSGTR